MGGGLDTERIILMTNLAIVLLIHLRYRNRVTVRRTEIVFRGEMFLQPARLPLHTLALSGVARMPNNALHSGEREKYGGGRCGKTKD